MILLTKREKFSNISFIMKILKLIFPSLITFIMVSLITPQKTYATVLFQDDFSDNDFNSVLSRWETTRNTCTSGNNWELKGGRVGITINNPTGACQTEFAPKDSVWGEWNNYIYEVDMILPQNSGTDKNTAFRYSGSPNFYWYGLHFQVNSVNPDNSNVVLERVCSSPCGNSTTYPVANGSTYHLKMIADNNHISAYIDGNLVIDIPQVEREFSTGKIALRAGVGGDRHTEVYFDNVVVSSIEPEPTPTPTPTPTPAQEPIVILPGMTGSWCKAALISGSDCPSDWTALPEPLDPYDSLVASIADAPDIPDDNVFVFYYDWRDRINDLSSRLNTYINSTVLSGKPAGTKVKLIGHSYGGLVAADYAEDHPDKVAKLITAGSPHKGVVKAYGGWEGGELWGFKVWERIVLRILLAARGGLFPSLKDTIRNDVPSTQEILPIFDYLTNQNNQTVSESSLNQRNPKLGGQYTGLLNISSLLTTLTGLENISENTLSSIKVKPRNWMEQALGLWEDGKPDQLSYSTEGDTAVLRSSGRYDNAAAKPEVTAAHVGLISETPGINAILSALGSSASAQITDSLMDDSKSYTIIFLRSPATVSVTVGGQTYSDADADGLIILDDSATGNAAITLTGTGSGEYHLDILSLDADGDSTQTFTGNITSSQTVVIPVNLQPSDNQPDQLNDTTGEKTLDFAKNTIDEMASDLSSASGRARSKQILTSGLNQIKNTVSRAKSQINQPAQSAKTLQAAILSLHHFRSSLNAYAQANHIDSSTSAKLRSKSENAINLLQSAFDILSSRAGQTFPSRQLEQLSNLVSRQTDAVSQQAGQSSKDKTAAAAASLAAAADQTQADSAKTAGDSPAAYINYISARMYLNEALTSLR